jgi:hypothetical protein
MEHGVNGQDGAQRLYRVGLALRIEQAESFIHRGEPVAGMKLGQSVIKAGY